MTRHFFIVGAPKAGTTWLAGVLASHRQVHLSPIKEPHFFAPPVAGELNSGAVTDKNVWKVLARCDRAHNGWIRDSDNYDRLLAPPFGKTIAGEATAAYLHAPMAAKNISRRFPEAHIIIILREPVSRALSHISMDRVSGLARRSSPDILHTELEMALRHGYAQTRYLSRSLYADALARYMENFTRSRLLMLRFDDIRSSPDTVLARVAEFLEVSPDGFERTLERRNEAMEARWQTLNELLIDSGIKNIVRRATPQRLIKMGKQLFYRKPRDRALHPKLVKGLRGYFEHDIGRTEAISELDLSAWRAEQQDEADDHDADPIPGVG